MKLITSFITSATSVSGDLMGCACIWCFFFHLDCDFTNWIYNIYMNVSESMHRDFIIITSIFIYCSTAKLLERQIERERARKVDEVCLQQKCLLIISILAFRSLVNTHFYGICLFCLARTSLHRAQTRQGRRKRFARLIVSYLVLHISLFLVIFSDNFYLISLQILIACLLDNVWVLYGEVAYYWLT